jgi:altronate dehydratase large subunit
VVDAGARGFVRFDGRVGCRNHLLVLPSVVCATRVARDIADATGGVAVVHQHGCSQIGDDEVRTATAFEQLACSPNVGAVLVVSLGCETVQGRELANTIARRGQRVEFVGIQDSGGSDAAVARGRSLAEQLAEELADLSHVPVGADRVVVGIESSRPSTSAAGLAMAAAKSSATLIFASPGPVPQELVPSVRTVPAFDGADAAAGGHVALEGAGSSAEQHTALAAAGAQLIVSFPAHDAGSTGFPLCPVVTIAGGSALHAALADEFDASEPIDEEELWRRVVDVLSGSPSAAETLGHRTFALSRLARSM